LVWTLLIMMPAKRSYGSPEVPFAEWSAVAGIAAHAASLCDRARDHFEAAMR
jgi:hypothetical protein